MNTSELGMNEESKKISIGVSACLVGAKVRFDGGHKRSRYITDLLGSQFKLVSYCPEVAIGMGTPREPIRLVTDSSHDSLLAVGSRNSALDVTTDLKHYGDEVATNIEQLCGFIFKKDSPSCGMERVKVYVNNGMPQRVGTGLFAQRIMHHNPLLPVEEEGRLNDPILRENFINRVYVYHRWMTLQQQGITKSGLIGFHTRHKYLLLAHDQQGYRELGRMLAALGNSSLQALATDYISRVMEMLKRPASRKTHVNVMQHLLGFLRKSLDDSDRVEMLDAIGAYKRGEYPLIVPIALLRHHFRCNPHPFVDQQVYLEPYPREMMLRNNL